MEEPKLESLNRKLSPIASLVTNVKVVVGGVVAIAALLAVLFSEGMSGAVSRVYAHLTGAELTHFEPIQNRWEPSFLAVQGQLQREMLAIDREQFAMHRVSGSESLIRWRDGERERVYRVIEQLDGSWLIVRED